MIIAKGKQRYIIKKNPEGVTLYNRDFKMPPLQGLNWKICLYSVFAIIISPLRGL